ncbi:hypothetical protein BO70DRAFT_424462 [Aspergillus heteromorphus CBS 117.55]|uniref:Hemolysin-III channel protein Izh2 n=1 Tax=Aspergillus heteromorphus CBS 117.55 TaxID=1448321 RepID=A0A317WLH9_9EURO|nr:uncharacterized protein BO70DRAFT_424462 [Aspergillus heteromorphus CBS 117.55]PWY85080.1 hypothetical protein BO70DRAFT_424462 [Aspergillus heteromorphus CBS 117.55]
MSSGSSIHPPDWYQDNPFIHHGYRPVSHSTRACLASWRYLRNETFNIYSHLAPAILFLLAGGSSHHYLRARYPDATGSDHAVFTCFLLTAVFTLGMSASALKRTYWTMIATLSCLTASVQLNPRFQGRRWRTLRTCAFVATGLSGFAPLIHGTVLFGFPQMVERSGMLYYLGEGLLLILGAFLYTTQIPESLWLGKFDLFGSSHQIFHLTVVLGTAIHLMGILSAFDYNYRHGACRLP